MEGECNPFTPAQGFRAIAFNKRVISTPAVFLITVCFFLRHILGNGLVGSRLIEINSMFSRL